MKAREMNSLALSLCEYICSRNNDIAGYWGIGVLCSVSKAAPDQKFRFRVHPGKPLHIYGFEISRSKVVTDKLAKFGLDSITGQLSYFGDGRYPHGAERYMCGVAIGITQDGRLGMGMCHVECWPHDSIHEQRRNGTASTSDWMLRRLGRL